MMSDNIEDNKDDNGIIIDSSSRKKRILLCVICDRPLDYIEPRLLKCWNCKNQYVLEHEIIKEDTELESIHFEENVELSGLQAGQNPIIITADDIDFSNEEKKSGFHSMDYVLGPGKKIVEYREEIPTEEE